MKIYKIIAKLLAVACLGAPFVVFADKFGFWPATVLCSVMIFFMPQIGAEIENRQGDLRNVILGAGLSAMVLVAGSVVKDIDAVAIFSMLLVVPGITLGPKQ